MSEAAFRRRRFIDDDVIAWACADGVCRWHGGLDDAAAAGSDDDDADVLVLHELAGGFDGGLGDAGSGVGAPAATMAC